MMFFFNTSANKQLTAQDFHMGFSHPSYDTYEVVKISLWSWIDILKAESSTENSQTSEKVNLKSPPA